MVDAVTARSLIDSAVDRQVFVLDLGEDAKYYEVNLPRFTTWYAPGRRGLTPELIALNQMLNPKSITEALSKEDRSQVEKIVKKELEAFAKQDKKDDLTLVKNVLISFVKSLYAKRGAWTSDLSADKTS
jgi:hypothetical protein